MFVKNDRNAEPAVLAQRRYYQYGRSDDRLGLPRARRPQGLLGRRQALARAGRAPRLATSFGLTVDTFCTKGPRGHHARRHRSQPRGGHGALSCASRLADPSFDDTILKASIATALTERANQSRRAARDLERRAGVRAVRRRQRVPRHADQQQAAPGREARRSSRNTALAKLLHLSHACTTYFGPTQRHGSTSRPTLALGDGKRARARAAPREVPQGRRGVHLVDQQTAQTQRCGSLWPQPPATDNDRAVGSLFGGSNCSAAALPGGARAARARVHHVSVATIPARARDRSDARERYAFVGHAGRQDARRARGDPGDAQEADRRRALQGGHEGDDRAELPHAANPAARDRTERVVVARSGREDRSARGDAPKAHPRARSTSPASRSGSRPRWPRRSSTPSPVIARSSTRRG